MLERLLRQTKWAMGAVTLLAASAVGVGLADDASPVVAGGGCHQPPANQDATGDAVLMQAFCFTPTVLRVQPGAKVTFLNRDEGIHLVNGLNWGSVTTLSNGERTEQKFEQPGLYPYACPLHPGMVGVVVVGDGKFVGSTISVSTVLDVKASVAQPLATNQAVVASEVQQRGANGRSLGLYVGLGALAGVVVAGAVGGVLIARR